MLLWRDRDRPEICGLIVLSGPAFNLGCEVHCLGDGATWIADQASRVFGTQAGFLVDFYHVCEYLGEAAQSCAPEKKESWLQEQKHNLKTNNVSQVLEDLKALSGAGYQSR